MQKKSYNFGIKIFNNMSNDFYQKRILTITLYDQNLFFVDVAFKSKAEIAYI